MTHDLRTISLLTSRLLWNWIRRSARSPFFWIVIAFLLLVLSSEVASLLGFGPDEDSAPEWFDPEYLVGAAGVMLPAATLIGLWFGVGSAPRASLADVVVLMGSPVAVRVQFLYLIVREVGLTALGFAAWSFIGFGSILTAQGGAGSAFRGAFAVFLTVMFAQLLRFAVWAWLDHMGAGNPERAADLRRLIRFVVLLTGAALIGYALSPLFGGAIDGWQDAGNKLLARATGAGSVPPMSWLATMLNGEGAVLAATLGIAVLPALVGTVAVLYAHDFVEAVSINAERITDARGQMTEPGVDVQWAAISQLGSTPKAFVTIRPFGDGPWALLWASLVRWVRYELAAAWIGLLILGGFGVMAAILIRMEIVSVYLGWALVVIMPMFSSASAFMDELRKPFLFLTPGPVWKRLLASVVTSVLDGFVAGLIVIIALAVLGALTLAEVIGLTVICLGVAMVAQGAVALVQIILPFWTPQRLRMLLMFSVAIFGATPALGIGVLLYVATSALPAMLVSAALSAIWGAVMLALGARFFDRVEFSG